MYFHYALSDWRKDWGAMAESSLTLTKEDSPGWGRSYFHSHYTNPLEADWKLDRQIRAYRYMEKHAEVFEAGSWIIMSTKRITIGNHLALALFRFFSHADDERVVNVPPPEIIMAAAEEHRQHGD
jgi:hypothetical protein